MSFSNAPIGTTHRYAGNEYMKILDVVVEVAQVVEGGLTIPSKRNAVAISGPAKGILVHWTEEGGFKSPQVYTHPWRRKSWLRVRNGYGNLGWIGTGGIVLFYQARWYSVRGALSLYELYRNWGLYKRIILTWWEEKP